MDINYQTTEEQPIDQKRIIGLDLIKAICMIMVILCHTMMKFIKDFDSNYLFNFIWLIQMPTFFFVSGFLHKKSFKCFADFAKWAFKNVFSYLIPYFSFAVLLLLVKENFDFSNTINDPTQILWFLFVLFWITLFFGLGVFLAGLSKAKILKFILPVLCVAFLDGIMAIVYFKVGHMFFASKYIIYYSFYYLFGFLFELLFSKFIRCNKRIVLIKTIGIFASLLCLSLVVFLVPSVYGLSDESIKDLFIRVGGSISGSIFMFFVFFDLKNTKFNNTISKAGRFSLEFYYLHLLALAFIPTTIGDTPLSQWGYAFLFLLILILVCSFSILILYAIPFGHFILFGKSFSFYKFERKLFLKNDWSSALLF
jgi:fucose 4-O-acetylase-like acetyltransferase